MQECLRREEDSIKTTPITAAAAVVTATPAPVVTATPAAVVSYNDLCFPKTSNYGSMRKAGRCEVAMTRSRASMVSRHSLQATNAEYAYS